MKLSKDEVLHIAELARLGLSDSEVERFREQLSDILTYAERLQSVDLSAIPRRPTRSSRAVCRT